MDKSIIEDYRKFTADSDYGFTCTYPWYYSPVKSSKCRFTSGDGWHDLFKRLSRGTFHTIRFSRDDFPTGNLVTRNKTQIRGKVITGGELARVSTDLHYNL